MSYVNPSLDIKGTISVCFRYTYMPRKKKSKTEVIKQATKNAQDNPYLKTFLAEYEEETGLKTRFTAKKDKFLTYLVANNGFISHAAKEMGYFPQSVRFAMKGDPAFQQAVKEIQQGFLTDRLDELEKLSFTQAGKAGNVTERIFQLKAHDPGKYRDRTNQQNTQVNVMVSGTSPKDREAILKKMKIN
tara:strand:+ start:268 stop:831 length:564 start_codon:yes stop_codon:yes gene_type:complete